MKPMLDKDFDAFFKSSFEDLEIAPATDSWEKISKKTQDKPRKKNFPVFWMAAASVLIVLGVGISLYTKPIEVIKLHPDGEKEMMANLVQEQNSVVEQTPEKNEPTEISFKKAVKPITQKLETPIEKNPIETDTTTDIAQIATLEPADVKPIRAKLATEQLLEAEEMAKLKKSLPVSLAENTDQVMANASAFEEISTKKLRIPSVGELVNFVVAKVDKRDEKIIKVSKTNESDNEITGINLGLFKFRKQD